MIPALPPNPVLGRYEVGPRLGEGGMGAVYRARDLRLGGRPCALKVLSDSAMTEVGRARFDREVRLTAGLDSRHIVKVDDTGRLPDGRPFLVMELLDGRPLDEVIRAGPLAPRRAVAIADGVLTGLAVAHAAGVIHRDVKPANVLLVRDPGGAERPVVLDFGIARPYRTPDVSLTGQGTMLGTPPFMSPEQITHGALDGRSDLYAVGLMIHMMLIGRHPFDIDRLPPNAMRFPRRVRYLWCHLHMPFEPPPGVSEALGGVLRALRAQDPDARYGSAGEVMIALRDTPEGAGLPRLDERRLVALAPKTVPVDLGAFDFGDVADTVATPAIVRPPPAAPATGGGRSERLLALAVGAAVLIIGSVIYAMLR